MKKAFVAGFPIHHSLSPHIHAFWLKKYHLDGSYLPQEVTSENFPQFIQSLKALGFVGGNVTLPHKEHAFRLSRPYDAMAARIGAVNTLWFEGDTLWGLNSDIDGFAGNLDDFAAGWEEAKQALVVGSGGAARAVIAALIMRGFKRILLANRTRERALNLAQHFGERVEVIDWDEMNKNLLHVRLIINTTSIGIERHDSTTKAVMPIDFSRAHRETIVSDIVYVPLKTPFLSAAEQQGLKIVDGLGMLLHQAVPGFERWFGIQPKVDEALRAHILKKFAR